MQYDAIVVGGGMAGLSAAAFLCKNGCKVLLCEKEDHVGGLVGSFTVDGFTFDAGIRAMENSGVLYPMLKALGLEIAFLDNPVSVGIENSTVRLQSAESLEAYRDMLTDCFPDDAEAIGRLIAVIRQTMHYMDVLYGIDNPLFMNLKDLRYVTKTLLPWALRYALTVGKIKKLHTPVEQYLRGFIQNQSLLDMIAQHFFKGTPAFFALSYFSLYLDYRYPKGGTGMLVEALKQYILQHGGKIQTDTRVIAVNAAAQSLIAADGQEYSYSQLIWAADSKVLYRCIVRPELLPAQVQRDVQAYQKSIAGLHGGDSVLTLYLMADLAPDYFSDIHSPHYFYTPDKTGLNAVPLAELQEPDGSLTEDRQKLTDWMRRYLRLTTYEISVPVLRDPSMAPEGKTGLIISTLMDYALVKHIETLGWYEELKELCKTAITETLIQSVYPALAGNIQGGFVSTPLTIAKRTGNTDGAITGWAFTNPHMPAVSQMTKIAKSVQTPLPHIWQAGQWTYSPSGFPISILTGKMAADAAESKR